ncbi:MAG: NAD(P)/FAD-dependent oxidoreductase [Candidatus Aenigmatarchaeota archaeon]
MFDCVVVGAGPAGCRTAEIVAREGYEVLILEEHPRIGEPVQCTGLVSKRIGKIPREIILNKVKKAKFFCGKEFFEVDSREPMFVLDRRKYDLWLARKAKKAGAVLQTSTRFLDLKQDKILTTKGKFQTKILVGADGPNSTVAKKVGIELPKNLLFGLQVEVQSNFDANTVELHFGLIPNSFAWVVPEDEERARVGLLSFQNPNKYLEKFLKKRFGKIRIFNSTGDVIRYGLIKNSVSEKVLLVGDAACQVKPFSLGGLIYNKISSEIAGKAVIKSLEENNFSLNFLRENYDKKWKEKLAWPIRKGIFLRWLFSKISRKGIFSSIKKFGLEKFANFLDVDLLK